VWVLTERQWPGRGVWLGVSDGAHLTGGGVAWCMASNYSDRAALLLMSLQTAASKEYLIKRQIIFIFVDSVFPRLYSLKFSCKQEIRSVELGVCPMQLFIWNKCNVTFIQFKICCCVQNFIKIGWFFAEIWRYNDFQNGAVRHLGLFYHRMRPPMKSLLLAAAACQISCQSGTQIWRYSYLNCSHIWLEMPILAPKMGVLGDFGPLNVIMHHWDPQKAHPCVNPRLLSYQL